MFLECWEPTAVTEEQRRNVWEGRTKIPDTEQVRNTLHNRNGRKAFVTEKNSVPFA